MAHSKAPTPSLRVVSHNAQGLNSPVKRRKAFQTYHKQKIDFILLQETHFLKRYNPSFLHTKYPTFYIANADDKKRGVTILFSKTCKFSPHPEHRDPDGKVYPGQGYF